MGAIRNAGVTLLAIVLVAFILWDIYGVETESRSPERPGVTISGGLVGPTSDTIAPASDATVENP